MAYTTVNKSTDYFNTLLYTGTGSGGSNRQLTGVGFQPDWTWIKNRSSGQEHVLVDAVRGATKSLDSSSNSAESTTSTQVGAFISDGFQLGSGSVQNRVNGSGNSMAAWNWKANGAGSANTAGTINSTVSVNTTAGFSIVKWTGNGVAGASIGHGLGVVPKLIIVKRLNDSANWTVYHASLGNTHRTELNNTGASSSDAGAWNNQTPTTTLFYTGNNLTVGNNGSNYIAYCFAEKTGYSKFASYNGNGNANGTFIYTGFKPALVIYKGASGTGTTDNWEMLDNKRTDGPIGNPKNETLYPNLTNAEGVNATDRMDFLSNGFKLRTNGADYNNSSATYIYMAFGQSLVGSNNVPCTAR